MKANWNDNEIKQLFEIVENNKHNNLSTLQSFKEYSALSNRNTFSIRNFYYQYVRYLNKNPQIANNLGIDLSKHSVQSFEHFSEKDKAELIKQIENLTEKGLSVRNACEKLANGNIKEMLRIQNKYRSLSAKQKPAKVIPFPKQKTQNNKLSDEDIKSLFMGLVKLVKENEKTSLQNDLKLLVSKQEQQKRKELVLLEQKQIEIEMLKKEIAELTDKNKKLNEILANYRINFVKNSPINTNNWLFCNFVV